jgi:hypothetical protein
MSIRKLFSVIFGITVLSTLLAKANAQVTDRSAREQASNIVRSELRDTVNLKPDQFLSVQRDETLERSLALAVGRTGSGFIYRFSPSGEEIKKNAIVHHISTDVDFMYVIAVGSADGKAYRIHGFGLTESLVEFERLMAALKVQVSSPDQAEALAGFYREVNPGNQEGFAPMMSLMDLKQTAERQCQTAGESFDTGEKAFTSWWKRAEPLYGTLPFQQKAVSHGSGYLVEWIVLSSSSAENCGGAPLRALVEINSDGQVGKVTFAPLQER